MPYVTGPVVVNQARGFIIVMSDGLYDGWSAYTGEDTSKANTTIASMVAEQIRGNQPNMEAIARTVINSVVSSVQSTYTNLKKPECSRLDDITLMIHNLGYDAQQCPLNRIVSFPLATTPVPNIPPPTMNSYFSQPGGYHQGQGYSSLHQGPVQYNQPIQHMPQSYDPRYIASQYPPRGQPPMNYYTPTPIYHPRGTGPENPFVFPTQPQQPMPISSRMLGPSQYPMQEHSGTNYNITNHSRNTSDISSSGYGPPSHPSSFNNSYNMPADNNSSSYSNLGLNYSGSVSNTSSLMNAQQRHVSTSPVPPQVNYPTTQQVRHVPVSHSASNIHYSSTSDEDGDISTPIADPTGKEIFPADGKKPVPLPRSKVGESLSTLTKTGNDGTDIPPPQSSSTPKKENEGQHRVRDSLDASNLKDEDLYGSENEEDDTEKREDTFEAPIGGAEKVELAENQPVETKTVKSSEGNQLDQYIFDSDGEMENQLEVASSGHSSDELDDDEEMGTVDTSKLSSVLLGEEPQQNTVFSYIKFDNSNFPDIEYDAL